jgi:HD-like signal output (HDOD) protein
MTAERELIEVYAAYLEFLEEANHGPIGMALAHGWRFPQADVDKGAKFRKRIAKLRARIDSQDSPS